MDMEVPSQIIVEDNTQIANFRNLINLLTILHIAYQLILEIVNF